MICIPGRDSHHGLGALELVSQGQEDGLNVVGFAFIHCGRLEEGHAVEICKLLCHVGAHRNLVLAITFVSNENAGNVTGELVLVTLLHPERKALVGGHLGHVIHKDNGMDIAVVVLYHTLPEPLLTSRVPKLQLDLFAVHINSSFPKVNTDRGLSFNRKLPTAKTVRQTRLAHICVSNDNNLEYSLLLFDAYPICRTPLSTFFHGGQQAPIMGIQAKKGRALLFPCLPGSSGDVKTNKHKLF